MSESNLTGGVRASREGKRRVKARISKRWSEEEGRERREFRE